MIVACKTYTNENSENEFSKEAGTLDILKEGFRGSRRVMQHIASIVHGNEFMILLPLAELHDLEVFLRGGRKPRADTQYFDVIYDFDKTFPHLNTNNILHEALLKELFEIAAALVWLHEELHILGSLDRYLAHLDLKPENILISRDSHAPNPKHHHLAGKWMLTDFGVSVFDKATNEKASRVHSIRDVGPRLTSKAKKYQIMRGHGPYEPPEVDHPKVDGTKCDVWSFACIMCDILAFASGRDTALLDFRRIRFDGKDDYFYRVKGSVVDRGRTIDISNTEVKPDIQDWFRTHAKTLSSTWIIDYVAVLEEALVPQPKNRPTMRMIERKLERLPRMIKSATANSEHLLAPDSQSKRPLITFADDAATTSIHGVWVPATALNLDAETPVNCISSAVPLSMLSRFPGQENHSQSSSSTEVPEPHASNRSSGLDPAKSQAAGYLSTALRPVQHVPLAVADGVPRPHMIDASFKASVYEQMPKIVIPLDKGEKVNAIAMTPEGDKMGLLYHNRIHTFWTENGSTAGIIYVATTQIKWKKMCLTSEFALIYGLKSRDKLVSDVTYAPGRAYALLSRPRFKLTGSLPEKK
jgi:serine/threonine protein kinase